MSDAKRKALAGEAVCEGESSPAPQWDGSGVPFCSEECPHHDGKRCRLLGSRPDSICEPVVTQMAKALAL